MGFGDLDKSAGGGVWLVRALLVWIGEVVLGGRME